MMTTKQATCQERVSENMQERLDDLRTLWQLNMDDSEASNEELGNVYEYGLSFDYVAPDTFNDQDEGYFRYQLSWGGPGDEFRIYADQRGEWDWSVYRIEYWFLDWFDGAHITLYGDNLALLDEIFECFFVDSGTADHQYNEALA